MLYMYPTGVPIPIAAAGLRESLVQAKMMYDPDGRDPAFEQMVLLGHSMGGILSRTMAVSSGDQLWRLYSDRPFDEILGPREVLDELRRYFFFEPLPFVSRVVFLATPHRGSDMSRGVVGRVGTSLISDPDHIHKLLYQLVKDNPDAFDSRRFRRLPTSIETLEPNSPILTALLNMQPPPPPHAIKFHSIIGSLRPTGVDKTTDGVVPYQQCAPGRGRVRDRSCARTTASRKTPRPSARSAASSASTSASARPRRAVQEARALTDADAAAQAGNAGSVAVKSVRVLQVGCRRELSGLALVRYRAGMSRYPRRGHRLRLHVNAP